MRTGKLRQDESCHWYVIPEELVKEHDDLSMKIDKAKDNSDEWYDLIDEYEQKYSQYRNGGGVYDLKVIIDDNSSESSVKKVNHEYLRRNLIHAKSVGICSNLEAALERLRASKSPVKWLIDNLSGTIERAIAVEKEIVSHRAEVDR